MNICILGVNFVWDQIDGVGVFTTTLAKSLCLDSRVSSLTIYCPKGSTAKLSAIIRPSDRRSLVKFVEIPYSKIGFLRVFKKLFGPDPIHNNPVFDLVVNTAPPVNFVSSLRHKTVTIIHDVTPLKLARKQSALFRIYYWFIINAAILLSRQTYCVSAATMSELEVFNVVKFAPKPRIIPNAVFLEYKESSQKDPEPFFLIVSTIQPAKNIEMAIRAFSVANSEYFHGSFKLVIVGKYGWGCEGILDLPKKLGIEDIVIFTGYISSENLSDLYGRSWCLLNLSIAEGFGIPIIEAFASNCPAILSDIIVFREVAGKAAIFVDPFSLEDIVSALKSIASIQTRAHFSSMATDALERYTPSNQADALLSLLQ